ncbi:MAG TPA: four helix bundle protein [Longimicrobiaceae bacterium]
MTIRAGRKGPARRFQDLIVWEQAHQLVLATYKESAGFPSFERYGLIAQLRRSAVSVPANIAEGFRKRTRNEKARYFNIAEGSLEETRYYLILARDLGYLRTESLLLQVEEVSRLLNAYSRKLLASGS